jgi:hypothetical protein
LSLPVKSRRARIAPLLAAACVLAHGAARAHDDEAAAAARLPQRVALLARAQAELERGDATAALDDFERAAMMLHAADAELGLIRAAMQDGQYRRALAFCAHTAGEHTDDADGGALYAWLLRIGGQGELAQRALAQARAQAPDDAIAAAVQAAFAVRAPAATGILRESAHRMAPWPVVPGAQSAPPATARFAGNAALVDDGATALLPSMPLAAHARVWVRNGLGQTTEAVPDRSDAALEARGWLRLQLRSALPVGASLQSAGRAPFAGSPGYALQFGAGAEPAWPMLTQGFLGDPLHDSDVRKLGFGSAAGAPVLDARGALIGVALASSDAQSTWLPLSAITAAPATAAAQASGLVAPDAIYEAGLRRTLQVLVVDAP